MEVILGIPFSSNIFAVLLTHSQVVSHPLGDLELDLISELDDFVFWLGHELGVEEQSFDISDNVREISSEILETS